MCAWCVLGMLTLRPDSDDLCSWKAFVMSRSCPCAATAMAWLRERF